MDGTVHICSHISDGNAAKFFNGKSADEHADASMEIAYAIGSALVDRCRYLCRETETCRESERCTEVNIVWSGSRASTKIKRLQKVVSPLLVLATFPVVTMVGNATMKAIHHSEIIAIADAASKLSVGETDDWVASSILPWTDGLQGWVSIIAENVTRSVVCKTVVYSIGRSPASELFRIQLCRALSGAWEPVRAADDRWGND